jgi:hypothetical protein
MARKIIVEIDNGLKLDGLTRFGEVPLEKGMIDIPTLERIVKIQNGIITMPEVQLSFETKRDGATRKFLRSWYYNNEAHSMNINSVDASGAPFDTVLWEAVECRRMSEPEVDFANPTYARIDVTLIPYNITPVE